MRNAYAFGGNTWLYKKYFKNILNKNRVHTNNKVLEGNNKQRR